MLIETSKPSSAASNETGSSRRGPDCNWLSWEGGRDSGRLIMNVLCWVERDQREMPQLSTGRLDWREWTGSDFSGARESTSLLLIALLITHTHTHTNTDTAAAAASEILIPIKMQLRLYVSSSGSSKRCSFVWFFCINTSLRWDKMEKLVIWRRIYCVRCISGSYFKHPAVAKHYFSMWREKKQIYLHYFSHLAWCLATMEVLILTWAHLK